MFALSAIASTLFLGGWYLPGLPIGSFDFLGPVILMAKTGLLVFLIIWFRWTFPRLREDQLQTLAWKWLVPLALLNIAGTAVAKVVF